MKQFQKDLQKQFDPFGIFTSLIEVQQAWFTDYNALADSLTTLSQDLNSVQGQIADRFTNPMKAHTDAWPSNIHDERFHDTIWTENPVFDVIKQNYLLINHWLIDSALQAPGVDKKTQAKASFWTRSMLNALAPTNFFWSNPEAIIRHMNSGGATTVKGIDNFFKDMERGTISMVEADAFTLGEDLATTEGAVVFQNELLELIQYKASTEQVHEKPILLVAPPINKYYILDLGKRKSIINYLVDNGFTVFVTSWKNITEEQRETKFEDYMLKGVGAAVEAANAIAGGKQVHLTGYCLGGTLVTMYMAWLNRAARNKNQLPVADWTLWATLVDFSDPGDIGVMIDEDCIEEVERMMAKTGYMDGENMAASFRLLRSNSLIWHYYVNSYLYGETLPVSDVLFWNMDTIRLPEKMHSGYLRECYLNNNLCKKDAVTLGDRKIDLGRIPQHLYLVSAQQDHVTPWQSTFKICNLIKAPVRNVLATSGHIMGIISPVVNPPKRHYWVGDATGCSDGQEWLDSQEQIAGSWWEDWSAWLTERSDKMIPARELGNKHYPVLCAAPGTYVFEK